MLELSFPEPLSVKMLVLHLVVLERYYTYVYRYLVTQVQTHHIQIKSNSSFSIY